MKIAVLDLETTGDDAQEDTAIECGVVFLSQDGSVIGQFHSLIHPGDRPINPLASACHHITKETFDTQSSLVIKPKFWKHLLSQCAFFVSHNSAFDSQFIPLKRRWICTYRCALHLYPNAPKHSLQALRYWLDLKPNTPIGLHPHRALYDATCCVALLIDLLSKKTLDELYAITTQPLLLPTIKFGKHRGTPFNDIPLDYLRWILTKDFDADTKHTAYHWLNNNGR